MSPASGVRRSTPLLFVERGCPFAHRVLALAKHLGVPMEVRSSFVGERPEGLEAYSRCGLVPLLVHESIILTESRVMLEHLAEQHEMADAYPPGLTARTSQRYAMAVIDGFLAPRLHGPLPAQDRPRLEGLLDALDRARAPAAPTLLAFHVAPLWLRFRWWHPSGSVVRAVERRPALCDWLDAVAELDAIEATTPSALAEQEALERGAIAGLLDAR